MAFETIKRAAGYADMARRSVRLSLSKSENVRQKTRQHLVERMGKLHGLPQKLGQILSYSDGAAAEFNTLQNAGEPLPWDVVRPHIEQVWGCPIEDRLDEIDPHGLAASLGQVHRGRDRDGRLLAIKVQYPNIRQHVMDDLKLLGWLSLPVGNLRRGFDLSGYRQVIRDDLEQELDYRAEADRQRAFSGAFADQPALVVPEVVDELCGDCVLVSTWEEGEQLAAVCDTWSEPQRRAVGRTLLNLFCHGLFEHGLVHADLHPGNLWFRRTGAQPQVVLYDYGCVFRPSKVQRLTLLRLIRATGSRSESPYPLLLALGFDERFLEPMAGKLPALCTVMFEPFIAEYPYDVRDWQLAARVADILGDDRWNFRVAGPPQLLLLMRALHGLAFYLEQLKVALPWSAAMEPHLRRWQTEIDALQLFQVRSDDFKSLATHLKIRVVENGCTKVELTSQASCIDHLEDLLGEEITRKIALRGIKLAEIVGKIRAQGYRPGEVFKLDEVSKQVHVWME